MRPQGRACSRVRAGKRPRSSRQAPARALHHRSQRRRSTTPNASWMPEHALAADHAHFDARIAIDRRDQRNEAVDGEPCTCGVRARRTRTTISDSANSTGLPDLGEQTLAIRSGQPCDQLVLPMGQGTTSMSTAPPQSDASHGAAPLDILLCRVLLAHSARRPLASPCSQANALARNGRPGSSRSYSFLTTA